jgi:hypothetical protein
MRRSREDRQKTSNGRNKGYDEDGVREPRLSSLKGRSMPGRRLWGGRSSRLCGWLFAMWLLSPPPPQPNPMPAANPGHGWRAEPDLLVSRSRDRRLQPPPRRVDPPVGLGPRSPASHAPRRRIGAGRGLGVPGRGGQCGTHEVPQAPDHAGAPATTEVVQSMTEVGRTTCLLIPRSFGESPRASPTSCGRWSTGSPSSRPTTLAAAGC